MAVTWLENNRTWRAEDLVLNWNLWRPETERLYHQVISWAASLGSPGPAYSSCPLPGRRELRGLRRPCRGGGRPRRAGVSEAAARPEGDCARPGAVWWLSRKERPQRRDGYRGWGRQRGTAATGRSPSLGGAPAAGRGGAAPGARGGEPRRGAGRGDRCGARAEGSAGASRVPPHPAASPLPPPPPSPFLLPHEYANAGIIGSQWRARWSHGAGGSSGKRSWVSANTGSSVTSRSGRSRSRAGAEPGRADRRPARGSERAAPPLSPPSLLPAGCPAGRGSAWTMPILLFLIDTSASMNQRAYLGTSYLDIAKGAVEIFMKVSAGPGGGPPPRSPASPAHAASLRSLRSCGPGTRPAAATGTCWLPSTSRPTASR